MRAVENKRTCTPLMSPNVEQDIYVKPVFQTVAEAQKQCITSTYSNNMMASWRDLALILWVVMQFTIEQTEGNNLGFSLGSHVSHLSIQVRFIITSTII